MWPDVEGGICNQLNMCKSIICHHKRLTPPEPYTPLMAAVSMTLTVLVSPAMRTSVGLQQCNGCQLG